MTRIGLTAVGLCLISPLIASVHSSELSRVPAATLQGNGHFSFALIGDMPYGPEGDAKFPNIINEINADRSLSFVVHDGDFKNGSSVCSDEVFQNRLTLFNRFNAAFIYVPGDNEWTDCHRANNGSFVPTERLAYLRALFFPNEQSLGRHTMTLERQSDDPRYTDYRENVRWQINDVIFAGLHVVGSNNNFGGTPGTTPPSAEYVSRNAATLVWLHETFAAAAAGDAKAVMLVIQADPLFEVAAGNASRAGFNDFLAALESETIEFGRPVVLVHGDSHYFRIDKPMISTLSGRRVENFTRVATFGQLDN